MAELHDDAIGSGAGAPGERPEHDEPTLGEGRPPDGAFVGMVITTDVAADRTTVRLVGELDLASAPHVRWTLARVSSPALVVDLSRLAFIDAAGLSSLLLVRRRLERMGRMLVFQGACGPVRRVFEVSGLGDLVGQVA